jgi:hypothetical protein
MIISTKVVQTRNESDIWRYPNFKTSVQSWKTFLNLQEIIIIHQLDHSSFLPWHSDSFMSIDSEQFGKSFMYTMDIDNRQFVAIALQFHAILLHFQPFERMFFCNNAILKHKSNIDFCLAHYSISCEFSSIGSYSYCDH